MNGLHPIIRRVRRPLLPVDERTGAPVSSLREDEATSKLTNTAGQLPALPNSKNDQRDEKSGSE